MLFKEDFLHFSR